MDGSSQVGSKHERCAYFVLDWHHDPFAVPAALAYATACEAKYPELADDLRRNADLHGNRWAWLIENRGVQLCYGKTCDGASLGCVTFTDADALRFPTKEAADAFVHHHCLAHLATAMEHEWDRGGATETR